MTTKTFVVVLCACIGGLLGCGADGGSDDAPIIVVNPEGSSSPQPAEENQEPGPSVCQSPNINCSDQCVDTATDPANCGGCGLSCDTSELCVQGACAASVDDCQAEGCPAGHYCDESSLECEPGCASDADCPSGTCDIDSRMCECAVSQYGILPASELLQRPEHMTTADFDGDGQVDVVVSGDHRDGLEILFGEGDGTFDDPIALALGDSPWDLTHIDIGGDGVPDLLLSNSASDGPPHVEIMRNNGQGSFDLPTQVATQVALQRLAVADINGDGLEDFAGTNRFNDAVVTFIQQPDGTFESTLLDIFRSPDELLLADLDGDGQADMVVGDDSPAKRVLIQWGSSGGFTAGPQFDVDSRAHVATGDVNADGHLDIVVGTGIGSVLLIAGQGGRDFAAPTEIHDSGWVGSLTVGDVNSDGRDDILVVRATGLHAREDGIDALVSTPDGSFDVERLFAGAHTEEIALHDVTSDGLVDIVAANLRAKSVSVLPAVGPGSFETSSEVRRLEDDDRIQAIVLHDVDHDGVDDPIVASNSHISVFRSSDGSEQRLDTPARDVTIGDFTGDGTPDVIVGSMTEVTVFRGNPDGTFAPVGDEHEIGPGAYHVAVADFDEDGHLDIVTSSVSLSNPYIGFGDGAGGIREVVRVDEYLPEQVGGVVLGDYDGDGHLEIAAILKSSNFADRIAIYDGDGTTSFAEVTVSVGYAANLQAIAAVDPDADGRDELFVSVIDHESPTGAYLALLSPGSSTVEIDRWELTRGAEQLLAADSDGDGHLDLFAVSEGAVLRFGGDGTAGLAPPASFAIAGDRLTFGNLDGDGTADALWFPHNDPWFAVAHGTRACF